MLSADTCSAPPSTVAIIVFYNVIQCMNAIFFARRCFIATGRSKWVAGLLVVVVGGLVVVSSAVCVLNICVFVGGKSYIVVSIPAFCSTSSAEKILCRRGSGSLPLSA